MYGKPKFWGICIKLWKFENIVKRCVFLEWHFNELDIYVSSILCIQNGASIILFYVTCKGYIRRFTYGLFTNILTLFFGENIEKVPLHICHT